MWKLVPQAHYAILFGGFVIFPFNIYIFPAPIEQLPNPICQPKNRL